MKKLPISEDRSERAKQKELSRMRDAARLDAGKITQDQLNHENSFFSALPLKRFKIVAIGGKPLRRPM